MQCINLHCIQEIDKDTHRRFESYKLRRHARSLEIDNAREEDSGMYECEARNLNDTVVFGKLFEVSVIPRPGYGLEHNIFRADSLDNQVWVILSVTSVAFPQNS